MSIVCMKLVNSPISSHKNPAHCATSLSSLVSDLNCTVPTTLPFSNSSIAENQSESGPQHLVMRNSSCIKFKIMLAIFDRCWFNADEPFWNHFAQKSTFIASHGAEHRQNENHTVHQTKYLLPAQPPKPAWPSTTSTSLMKSSGRKTWQATRLDWSELHWYRGKCRQSLQSLKIITCLQYLVVKL